MVGNLFRLERKNVEKTGKQGANASRCIVDQGAIRSENDSEESVAERRVVESDRGSELRTLPFNSSWEEEGGACSAGGRGKEEAAKVAGRASRRRRKRPL